MGLLGQMSIGNRAAAATLLAAVYLVVPTAKLAVALTEALDYVRDLEATVGVTVAAVEASVGSLA